ncbi:MAG: copper chaperone PCu(A)C [Algicola sp.]|nr:copper chaperone PCu(A)C [Algicola sp.]
MKKVRLAVVFSLVMLFLGFVWPGAVNAESRWGAEYFPNHPLTTHEGKTVRFFDDLIKDKIVVINFIYTSCPDTCPLETAQLTRVARILGDRIGKDVFFYSISIDPEHDTPAVLKEYRERFSANWTFLTGDIVQIAELRKKLGLYIAEIQDGSNNHNVSMIIGNQKTGRWMKRSPFENAYVLADQIGNWLNGWKSPQKSADYASAPKLRNLATGEELFRTRCTHCHTVNGNEQPGALGPDLLNITERREMFWLINWLRAPDQMIKNKDPIALELMKKYNNLAMPNMRLNQLEAGELLTYIKEQSHKVEHSNEALKKANAAHTKTRHSNTLHLKTIVTIENAWVRKAVPGAKVQAGYMILSNPTDQPIELIGVESMLFEQVELHEMSMRDGMMSMDSLDKVVIPAKGQVSFKPGGKHLMMHQPKSTFVKDQWVPLTLSFKSGDKQVVNVKIEAR